MIDIKRSFKEKICNHAKLNIGNVLFITCTNVVSIIGESTPNM